MVMKNNEEMIMLIYPEYRIQFRNLVDNKQSFEIVGVPVSEMLNICEILENYIESRHLKCRIYIKSRLVSGLLGVLNPMYAVLSLGIIAAYNIITQDPDYEICRDLANNRVEVKYQR